MAACLVFVVTVFLKGLDFFDKVVDGCGVSDSLEDMWGILESLVFGCKVCWFISSVRPQEVAHEVFMKYGSKYELKWNHMEELT